MRKNNSKKNKFEKLHNYVIVKKFKKVSLVTDDGLKVMASKAALKKAGEQDLDLVMMSSKGDAPVCKIMDYKKYLYDAKKKEKLAKKNAKKNETKEIRLGLDIGKADIEHKAKKAVEFLESNVTLKVSLKIRGWRNMKRKDEGGSKIQEFFNYLQSIYAGDIKFTSKPKLQGRNWLAVVENYKKK